MDEGYKRCVICNFCELSSQGESRSFSGDVCSECCDSIRDTLKEFGLPEKDTRKAVEAKEEGASAYPPDNPEGASVEPSMGRQHDIWDELLGLIDEDTT